MSLLPATLRTPRAWLWLAVLCIVLVWGWVDVRARGRVYPATPAAHRTDFTVYTAAAEALARGEDPYEVRSPRGWRYLYPPFAALLLIPLAGLRPEDGVFAWFLISLALIFGCWSETRRLIRFQCGCDAHPPLTAAGAQPSTDQRVRLPPAALAAALAVLLPLFNGLQRGQLNLLVLYCILLGLRMVVTGRRWWSVAAGGAALSAAAVLKLTPVLVGLGLIGFLLLQCVSGVRRAPRGLAGRRWARLGLTSSGFVAGIGVFVFVAPAMVSGWGTNLQHLQKWTERMVLERDLRGDAQVNPLSVRNQSLANAAHSFGNWFIHVALGGPDDRANRVAGQRRVHQPLDHPVSGTGIAFARGVLLLMLAASVWTLASAGNDRGVLPAAGLACCATLLVSPLSWGHHYLLWGPGVLFFGMWLAAHAPRAALTMVLIPPVLTAIHYALVEQAGRVGVLGLGAAGWYMTACVLIARVGSGRIRADADSLSPEPRGAMACAGSGARANPTPQTVAGTGGDSRNGYT